MSNSFTLRDGQTVAIDFAQEPNLGDFTKLIALLELQRSFLDGSPAPQVVVDVRSAPQPKSLVGDLFLTGNLNGATIVDDPPDESPFDERDIANYGHPATCDCNHCIPPF